MEQIKVWFEGIDTEVLIAYAIEYGTALLSAIAIFVIGKWLALKISNVSRKMMEKHRIDPTITGFLANIIYYVLIVMVVIAAIGTLGVETTSMAAVIAAAGLAIGLALQGSLSNFAAGVMIVMFRPFHKGDFVSAGGIEGSVQEINIFTTYMKTPDNRTIIVPNGKIISDNIINFTANATRRIDLVIGVGYDDNLRDVKKVLTDILESNERVLEDPAPLVAVAELGDNSVNFNVRPWVKSEDYWLVRYELMQEIKEQLDAHGFSIPFPQRDVHHYGDFANTQPQTPAKKSISKKKS